MSSLFFDYPCKAGDKDERAVATDLAWCKCENILACVLDSGRVAIFQDEVRVLKLVERVNFCTCYLFEVFILTVLLRFLCTDRSVFLRSVSPWQPDGQRSFRTPLRVILLYVLLL